MKFKLDKKASRRLLTTRGYINYSGLIYRPTDSNTLSILESVCGSKRFVPLDIYFGLNNLPFKVTPDMALRIAMAGAISPSYAEAEDFFLNAYGLKIGDDLIRNITDFIGKTVFDEDKRLMELSVGEYDKTKVRSDRTNCIAPNPNIEERFVLYLLMDGGTYNSRDEIDKNGSTYREYKLGMAFKSTDLIIKQLIDDNGNKIISTRLGEKREYISFVGDAETFRKYLLALAIRNGLYEADEVVLLGDGADWIKGTQTKYFPYAKQILDLYHLFENVGEFAKYAIKNEAYRTDWIKETCTILESGGWQTVLALPEVAKYKGKNTPKGVPNLYRYIENHKYMLNYPEYKKNGYFIGSGAIEGGIKNVGHKRIKLGGMRWYKEKAQTVLSLRAKIKSHLWESSVVPLIYKKYSN